MQAGRPNELIASIAARQVRPVKSTSSTMMTVRCSSGSGSCEALTTGSPARVPTSSRCIETSITPVATPHFFNRLDVGRNPSRQFDAARRNPDQDERRQIAIALDDFVRDPAQRAAHRFRIEDADRASFFC